MTYPWFSRLSLACLLLSLTACGGGGGGGSGDNVGGHSNSGGSNSSSSSSGAIGQPDFYSVGGNVVGLSGSGLVLANNGSDEIAITENGEFSFTSLLEEGALYDVTVLSQPVNSSQFCEVINGNGIVGESDINDISINCINVYRLGGSISGFNSYELVIQNIGNAALKITENGGFAFETLLPEGSNYDVTILEQAYGQICEVSNGSGTIEDADIEDVQIDCIDRPSLKAVSEIMQVRLEWGGADPVDILYSTDADCDWENYLGCENAAMLSDLTGNELTLRAVANDLSPERPLYFVLLGEEGIYSEVQGARPGAVAFNGGISAVTSSGDKVYVGGNFTRVGLNTKHAAMLKLPGGELTGSLPQVEGLDGVNAVVPDGKGGWFIGGDFLEVNGRTRTRLAHILSNGALDEAWTPSITGAIPVQVHALAISGDTLFVGGRFNQANGQTRDNLAAFDAASGDLKDWALGVNGTVRALAVNSRALFVGGDFFQSNGQIRRHLAAFDIADGSLHDWQPITGDNVYAIAATETNVYVGGTFTRTEDYPDVSEAVPRNYIAAFDSVTGELTDWNPGVNHMVRALEVADGIVYAGGAFSEAGGQERLYLAAFDAITGELENWNPVVNTGVMTLDVYGETIFIGGSCPPVFGSECENLAAFNINTGLSESWNSYVSHTVNALAVSRDVLFIGGPFRLAGSEERSSMAAFDSVDGVLEEWNPGANGNVLELLASGNAIYAGGSFTNAGGAERSNLAAFDSETGELLEWNPATNGLVRALVIAGDVIYAGGEFTDANDSNRNRLAAFNVSGTGELTSWNPDANAAVWTLAESDGIIYAGGDFTQVGDEPRGYIAALDGITGDVEMDWNAWTNGPVLSFVLFNDTVYVGGYYTQAGGVNRSSLSAFDLETGALAGWNPGVHDPIPFQLEDVAAVLALAEHDGVIYVGGEFSRASSSLSKRDRLAAFNAYTGGLMEWNPGADNQVLGFAVIGDVIYIGGIFTELENYTRSALSAFNIYNQLVW